MVTRILVLTVSFLSLVALADPLATVDGVISLGGGGCPEGGTSITLSPDKTDVSIIFDAYSLITQRGAVYRQCAVRIPVKVQSGYKLKVLSAAYRGFLALPRLGFAYFAAQAFVRSPRGFSVGGIFTRGFRGPLDQDFLLRSDRIAGLSQCGGRMDVWLGSSALEVNYSYPRTDANFVIDSLDFSLNPISPDPDVSFTPCN